MKSVALSVQTSSRKGRVLSPLEFNIKTINITECSQTIFCDPFLMTQFMKNVTYTYTYTTLYPPEKNGAVHVGTRYKGKNKGKE